MMFKKRDTLPESPEARAHRLALIDDLTFEVVPMKGVDDAIEALPAGADVSVTCSPVKGIAETQRLAESLAGRGFVPIPHISARMVTDRAHAVELAGWFRANGFDKIFVVGGDAESCGSYLGAVEFLAELLELDHGLTTIGVTAYPDSHSFLSTRQLHEALHAKQDLLAAAGVAGYCSTQMCFDPTTVGKWLRAEREHGLTLPVHLGMAGVVDKAKLMTMGARLGVGASLRYLKKNKAAVAKMLTSVSYDPDDLLVPLSADLVDFGVDGLHVFTFNQVASTEAWRTATH